MFDALLWIFRQVQRAADEEMSNRGQSLREELANLYRMLQDWKISEEEFGRREAELLDELDAIESGQKPGQTSQSLRQ